MQPFPLHIDVLLPVLHEMCMPTCCAPPWCLGYLMRSSCARCRRDMMALERRTATLDLAEPCASCGVAVGAPPPAAAGAEAAAASQPSCSVLLISQTPCCLAMLQLHTL